MSELNQPVEGSVGQPPVETPPKNDAEAAAKEAAAPEGTKPEGQPEPKPDEGKKRNRTGEYIERINAENREMRRKLEELEKRLPKPEAPKPPDPNDFYADPAGFTQRQTEYQVAQARAAWEAEQKQQQQIREKEAVWSDYSRRVAEFASERPDFQEVVTSIPFQLPEEVQLAIARHPRGHEIAYHAGLNEQDAYQLAIAPPQYAEYAVNMIASRLKEAPESPSLTPALAQPSKPISQAPAPAPRVGGRSPVETPPEKMTDDEWYRQDRERRRKR